MFLYSVIRRIAPDVLGRIKAALAVIARGVHSRAPGNHDVAAAISDVERVEVPARTHGANAATGCRILTAAQLRDW
jgi:hypothetical protein